MSIASEINALTQNVSALDSARSDIRTALSEKGVTADTHNFSDFANDVRSIQSGGGGGSYRLPDAYQEVEYIETAGNQYIQTNLLISSTDSVEVEVAFTNNQQQGIFCAREGTGVKTFTVFLIGGKLRYDYGASQTMYSHTATMSLNHKYKIKLAGNKAYLDDVLIHTYTESTYSPVNPLNFLASYNPWGTYQNYSKQKFYGSRVKNSSGGYKGFFVTCYRKLDSVGGLYDLVTQTFYPPNNAVRIGPDVNIVTDSSISITNYNTTSGTITGDGFGSSAGTVWLLDRDTHTYSLQPTSSWTNKTIVLQNPINLSAIQGNSCFYVRTSDKKCSHKYMVYGDGTLTVPEYGLIYLRNVDGTISKITMNQQTNITSSLRGDSYYGKNVTINGVTLNTANIVGIQFGSSVTNYTISSNFLSGLISLNQPLVFPSALKFTSSATYFLYHCYQFDCPIVFDSDGTTAFGNYFMNNCESFNQPLDISVTNSLNITNFMRYCYSFNQYIKLPTTLGSNTTIANYFLSGCYAFDRDLTLPSNVTTIGNYFLSDCYAFNSEIKIPNTLTTIGTYFLNNCGNFNQELDISNITSVGNYFLYNCYNFDKSIDISKLTTIGTYFLSTCRKFNQELDTSGLTSIGNNFLSNCSSFNKELDLSSLTSIGQNFLYNDFTFNSPITLGSNLKEIKSAFLQGCYSFNKPIDFSKVETFGSSFLSTCHCFDQEVDLSSAKTIGTSFMSNNYTFSKDLYIPSTVTSIGTSFLQGNFINFSITVETSVAPTDNNSLSTSGVSGNAGYLVGHIIYGSKRSTWLSALPNITTNPYRKLIDGGS